MKYLYGAICAVLLLPLTFCYLNTTDKSRVSLNLNAPKPGVTALHVAVYAGSSAEEDLLLYQVFRPGTTVDLDVPAGENRIFVVWAEMTPGTAGYYGKSSPVNVGSDDTEEVRLSMTAFSNDAGVYNTTNNINGTMLYWDTIYGADKYRIYDTRNAVDLYEGSSTTADVSGKGSTSTVRIYSYSSLFGLASIMGTVVFE